MTFNQTLDKIIWDLEKLREMPDSTASFNGLEVTLQDWAWIAHSEAEKQNKKNKIDSGPKIL